jgi:class 3 adenylate cyclase
LKVRSTPTPLRSARTVTERAMPPPRSRMTVPSKTWTRSRLPSTTFSETRAPHEVIAMLNEFWAAVVPAIDQAGGIIEQFAGDGVLVLFNAVTDQPDHASRAARCALAILRVTEPVAAAHPGWPHFRIGLNTGPVAVGTVGAAGRQSFASIGDTTNLGSRLMSAGEPGQVVVGPQTHRQLEAAIASREFDAVALGPVRVKGKNEPVEVWLLRDGGAPGS